MYIVAGFQENNQIPSCLFFFWKSFWLNIPPDVTFLLDYRVLFLSIFLIADASRHPIFVFAAGLILDNWVLNPWRNKVPPGIQHRLWDKKSIITTQRGNQMPQISQSGSYELSVNKLISFQWSRNSFLEFLTDIFGLVSFCLNCLMLQLLYTNSYCV